MSEIDAVDAEFNDLLGAEDMADVEAVLADGNTDIVTEGAAAKADNKQPPATAQPFIPCNKPIVAGKKRQLLVPHQGSNKRVSLQVKASSGVSDGTAMSPKNPSPSPSGLTAEPNTVAAVDESAPSGPSSAASSPVKKPTAAAEATTEEDTKAAGEVAASDTEMADAPEEEPEVQSPVKQPSASARYVKPSTDAEYPATAATSGGAISTKALAAGKRKGLTVAKVADPAPSKPKALKAEPSKAAAKSSSTSGATTSNAPSHKLPKAQTSFFFFSADKRPDLKQNHPGLSMGETAKKLGEMWKELNESEKKPYNDKAIADKERAAAELAAMDPAVKAALQKEAADARAAKKDKKADKSAGKASKTHGAGELKAGETKDNKKHIKAAAKEAQKADKAAAKAEEAANKQALKNEKAEAAKKAKAAFKVFHTSMYPVSKADNPEADATELNSIIMKVWEALDQAGRDKYSKMAEEAAEAEAAAKAGSSHPGRAKGAKGAGKRGKKAAAAAAASSDADESESEDDAGGAGRSRRHATAQQDTDDDSDREDVDWEGNPAAGIFSHSADAFLVARMGLMLTEYGAVDSRKAKQRLLHGGASSSSATELPVSTQEVSDYEASCQKFWAAAKSRMHKGGTLDLEELEEGSPLELCYVLAKLQEKGQLLDPQAKRPKGDLELLRRLPVMRLSMVMQRLVELERTQKRKAQQLLREVVDAVERTGGDELKQCDAVAAATAMLDSI